MRKMLLVVVASGAVIAVTPATALAQHHSRHHHVRHSRIRHRKFGHNPLSTTTTTTTTPTTTPSAATVTSFDPMTHVLMLTLADGTTVSGTITNATRLVCVSSSQPSGMGQGNGQGDQGGDNGWDGHHHGDAGDWGGGDNGGGGGDQGGEESNQMCSTANLTTGTPVLFADLSVGQGGANWDTVVLVTTPSSTTPTVPDTDNDGD